MKAAGLRLHFSVQPLFLALGTQLGVSETHGCKCCGVELCATPNVCLPLSSVAYDLE